MDKFNLLSELDDKELDNLMAYSIPYTDENKINIKTKFAQGCDKLKEDKMLTRKRTKFTVIMVAAALFCLTTITVFAATRGAFYGLFTNIDDVAEYVQTPHVRATSSGITMELSNYLADDSGIAMELVFTRDDGLPFAADILGVGCLDELSFWHLGDDRWYWGEVLDDAIFMRSSPQVTINDRMQWTGRLDNISDDDQIYRSIIVAHDNFDDDNSLEISIIRLIYNIEAQHETANIDLYELYQNSEIANITLINTWDDMDAMVDLFDNAQDIAFSTESGIEIHSIVFARYVPQTSINRDTWQWPEGGDGMDIAGALFYNYIVGIRYTARVVGDGFEYHINPINLNNNYDPFSSGIVDRETGIGYQFFRVSCFDELVNYGISSFEHLKNIGGIDFTIFRHNFVDGDWHIQTQFSANRESSRIVLDKAVDTGNPDVTPFLLHVDISLFTTELTLEVRDLGGNINLGIPWDDMLDYVIDFMGDTNNFSLRYKNGQEQQLWFGQSGMCCCGIHVFTSGIPMTQEYFFLMNTSQLEAIVIAGVAFPITN